MWPVFALSCGILGFEIALMRVLLYASWHHFAFLLISVVLLGFGASGTVLCFLRAWLLEKGTGALFTLVVATAVGATASDILADLAAAIAADPILGSISTAATASGNQLTTNGSVGNLELLDPGLAGPVTVPASPAHGPLLLAAFLVALAGLALRRQRRQRSPA